MIASAVLATPTTRLAVRVAITTTRVTIPNAISVAFAMLTRTMAIAKVTQITSAKTATPPTNRLQYCPVNGQLSQPVKMITGKTRGSILDPLLSLIYINDLPNCLENANCNMFADDTQIEVTSNNIN